VHFLLQSQLRIRVTEPKIIILRKVDNKGAFKIVAFFPRVTNLLKDIFELKVTNKGWQP
jgi:hypothetical protein